MSFDQDTYGTGFGLCKMFGSKFDLIQYSFANHCRENENQCGKEGYLYEELESQLKFIKEKEEEKEEEKEKKKQEKFKDFIMMVPSSKNEKKNYPSSDLKDLKNTNSQLYDYSIFLNTNAIYKKKIVK